MLPRPLKAQALLGLLALAAILPSVGADPVDDALADQLGPAGAFGDYRTFYTTVCNKCDLFAGATVPQQNTPPVEVPDHEGTGPVETPDHEGTGPQELPDYPGTPPGPAFALGSVRVYDNERGDLCMGVTVEGATTGEQKLFCYTPGSFERPTLDQLVPRASYPLAGAVPSTDPYDTRDDLGATDPQDVPDAPPTDPQPTPDVGSFPVGPVRVPKYEYTLAYRAYYDCDAIDTELNVLDAVQTYRPFELSPQGVQWAKLNANQLHIRVYLYVYADGAEIFYRGTSVPLAGQLMATYGETVNQGNWGGC